MAVLSQRADFDTVRTEEVRRVAGRLRNLPASAAAVQRALEELDDPLCTNDRLGQILVCDQASAAGLLRLANSAYFGVPARVNSLNAAIRVVGLRRLEALLRHLLVGKIFDALESHAPLAARVRNVGLAAAAVCARCGGEAEQRDTSVYRLAGLLHNVGELALVSESPRSHAKAFGLRPMLGPFDSALSIFGVSYADVTAWLLESWRFPAAHVQAARHWPSPDEALPEFRDLTAAVHVGALLADAWQDGSKFTVALERVDAPALEALALSADVLTGWYEEIGVDSEALRRSFAA